MSDTIFAVASPPGRGGIGILRVSGPEATSVAQAVLGAVPAPRLAKFAQFRDEFGELLDSGIALYYPGPNSYTGEDVLELQGHGSPVVLARLSDCLLRMNLRLAEPGEFTQRAFLNDKLDLAQAEAVADLIASSSKEAARAATRSLSGEFSRRVHDMDRAVLELRVFIESAIDFAEEEIDFLSDEEQHRKLKALKEQIENVIARTSQGMVMQSGFEMAIAGEPNVGKSSLLNALLGEDRAIVTDTAGTTRDIVHGEITLDGLPVKLTDTAGLRESEDPVESIGVSRAKEAMELAEGTMWVVDDTRPYVAPPANLETERTIVVLNKCDLSGAAPGRIRDQHYRVSALNGSGLSTLCEGIKSMVGYSGGEDAFAGRPRHLEALRRARSSLRQAHNEMKSGQGELVAENLRHVHECLGEIVGETTSDDLLGEIFSTFCIGK